MLVCVNGVTLNYKKIGIGRPLIMLHGNGESIEIFNKAIHMLKEKYTVYAIDTRGHGKSSPVKEYHYKDMVNDVREFIHILKLEKPLLYGFSDGGIIGLILASKYRNLISELIISGANTKPIGIKKSCLVGMRILYFFTRDPKFKLMLEEPNITTRMLRKIKVPVIVIAGSKDFIRRKHTEYIARNIKKGRLCILKGEGHGTYIVNSNKIAKILLKIK